MQAKTKQFDFQQITETDILEPLKMEWRKSLTAVQDGMWETLTEYGNHWALKDKSQLIGYASVDDGNRLLQFFVLPNWMHESLLVFQQFIQQEDIKEGLIGTNNPICLSVALHFQKSVEVNTYLFTDFLKVNITEQEGELKMAVGNDLKRLIDFCHISMGGPKDWLKGYLGNLIEKKEVFLLEKEGEILGTCEVRISESEPSIADVGMIVSPNHRRKGIGTYLLGTAKKIALQWHKTPICSCEKDNIGSIKSIQKNGFRTVHQMLLMKF